MCARVSAGLMRSVRLPRRRNRLVPSGMLGPWSTTSCGKDRHLLSGRLRWLIKKRYRIGVMRQVPGGPKKKTAGLEETGIE